MTTTSINAVGLCAHYSEQGDWAFRHALALARSRELRLNIFHFLNDPYARAPGTTERLADPARKRVAIDREKELRLYYDERLGDYLNVGFRLCEDNGWTELHRCICKREFQVLFLPFPAYGARFAGRPLTAFAFFLVCPTVLVGPSRHDEVYLNSPAILVADRLGLEGCHWTRLERDWPPAAWNGAGVARPLSRTLDCQ